MTCNEVLLYVRRTTSNGASGAAMKRTLAKNIGYLAFHRARAVLTRASPVPAPEPWRSQLLEQSLRRLQPVAAPRARAIGCQGARRLHNAA